VTIVADTTTGMITTVGRNDRVKVTIIVETATVVTIAETLQTGHKSPNRWKPLDATSKTLCATGNRR
jgi:hypothetical protein